MRLPRVLPLLAIALLLPACGRAPLPQAAAPAGTLAARGVTAGGGVAPAIIGDGPVGDVAPGMGPRAEAPLQVAMRTTADGKPAAANHQGPVYLTPRQIPAILPGHPAPLPRFTPRPIDLTQIPVDPFVALAKAGRLRDSKRSALPWLFGQAFPRLTAVQARAQLGGGKSIWLAPDGSSWHRDKTYQEVPQAAIIDAMLPELQRESREKLQGDAREANIRDRQAILPAFNGTYDVWRLWALEAIVPGYSLDGRPVRRLTVACALLYERDDVRRRIATYWEDHPDLRVSELRQVTNRVLLDAFANIAARAATLAEDPAWYRDAQIIPGLRDPRPRVPGDERAHDEDVAYNRQAIRELGQLAPAALPAALYP